MSDKILHFAVMALGAGAERLGLTPWELKKRLERVGLIDSYVLGCYDTLHTESLDTATDDILEALRNWEKKKGITE